MKKIFILAIVAIALASCNYNVPTPTAPTIKHLTVYKDGVNWLTWTNEDKYAFPTINVYKEDSVSHEFRLISSLNSANCSFWDEQAENSKRAERYCISGVTRDGEESQMSEIRTTVHLSIEQGTEGTLNLTWNKYEDTTLISYEILRGATQDALNTIETLDTSCISYTDLTPDKEQPYYAIQYVIPYVLRISPMPDFRYGHSNVVKASIWDQSAE